MYFYEKKTQNPHLFQEITDQFFTPLQAIIWHTIILCENIVIKSCTLCWTDCTQWDTDLLAHCCVIVNLLIHCFYELAQLLKVKQKINCQACSCVKFSKSTKLPFIFYTMSSAIDSTANLLCVFDHLISNLHILYWRHILLVKKQTPEYRRKRHS